MNANWGKANFESKIHDYCTGIRFEVPTRRVPDLSDVPHHTHTHSTHDNTLSQEVFLSRGLQLHAKLRLGRWYMTDERRPATLSA